MVLQCSHEEADDRLFYHANHALKVAIYRILIATSDADIFASATQNFKNSHVMIWPSYGMYLLVEILELFSLSRI